MKLALVSTLIRAAPVLATWVAHHRALGFTRFYLFVDDPTELSTYASLPLGDVVLIARDAALHTLWQSTRDWQYHSAFVERQVYSRQCLNTNVAMQRAREDDCDWLLHLDIDERLHVPEGTLDLAEYFSAKQFFDMVVFTNHEAVPECWHIGNYFDEVTLFKRNLLTLGPRQQQITRHIFGSRYFLAYANGKSAVNLRGRALEADGVHAFRPVSMVHRELHIAVLHYTQCGFNWFYEKFVTLGEFEDRLIGLSDITKTFPMLAAGRETIVRGSIHEAMPLYRDSVLRQGGLPHSCAALLDAGVLVRIGESPIETL